jgi:hypothetical protein
MRSIVTGLIAAGSPKANRSAPTTPTLGEVRDHPELHQAQITATIAALVGEDFRAKFPEAAPPVTAVLRSRIRTDGRFGSGGSACKWAKARI